MPNVFPLPIRPAAARGVAFLCARIRRLGAAESPDEATTDAIARAEQGALLTLAETPSGTLHEAGQKLAAVADRGDAADGFLSYADLAVLRSVLDDLRLLGAGTEAA
jgi:hypothetical protein